MEREAGRRPELCNVRSSRSPIAGLTDGGWDHKPRHVVASRSAKGKEMVSPLEPPEGNTALSASGFYLSKIHVGFLQNYKMVNSACLKPLNLRQSVTAGIGN